MSEGNVRDSKRSCFFPGRFHVIDSTFDATLCCIFFPLHAPSEISMARKSFAARISTGGSPPSFVRLRMTAPPSSHASDSESETTTSVANEAEAAIAPSSAEGVARMPSEEPRSDSDLPSGWIQPTKPTRLSSNGRFRRPLEEPPMDGYVWSTLHGVWVPSGKYLEEIKKIKMRKPRKRRAPPPQDSPVSTPIKVPSVPDVEPPSLQQNATVPTEEETTPNPSPPLKSSKKMKLEKANLPEPPGVDPTLETMAPEASATSPPPLAVSQEEEALPAEPSGKKRSLTEEKDVEEEDEDEDDGFHPNSMWQEPNTNDLTLYEQHRAPRPAPTGTFICSMDALRQEFRCAICLDMLRHARIVRECLHRFCESCMEQALTFQNVAGIGGRRKECPICRVYIPSRRSLVPDPYMNTFIARLLDNLVWEEENDPQVYLTSPAKPPRPVSTLTTGQEDHKPEAVPIAEQSETPDPTSTPPTGIPWTEAAAAWNHTTPGLIHIHLLQGGSGLSAWDALEQPYIALAADAPARVIQQFLRRKHGCGNETALAVWTMYKTRPYVASDHDSLHYLLRHRSDAFAGQYMPLYYSRRDEAPVVQIVKRGQPRAASVI
jgi:Ring finger domain